MSSKTGSFIKIIIVLLEVGLIAAGGVLASRVWDPVWSPFRPKPEKVILQAWNQIKSIKSHNFEAELSVLGKDIKSEGRSGNFNFDVKGSGGVDFSDPKNFLSDITASLAASAGDASGNSYNLAIAGQEKSISKILYLKLDQLDLGNLGAFFMMFGVDASKIKGRWFKFNLEESAGSISSYAGVPVEQDQDKEKLKESLAKIVKVLLDKKVYDISQMPDNQGKDDLEYRYVASLNRQRLSEASPEIYNVLKEMEQPGQQSEKMPTLEEFQKSLNEFLDKAEGIKLEMFIGKKDGFFHKVQSIKEFNLSKINPQMSGTLKIDLRIEQSGINKPVQVTAPEKFITIEQLFSELTPPAGVIK